MGSINIKSKPIIIVTGTAGVGKTTISRLVSEALKIDHRLGTGFIREILRTVLNKNENAEIFSFTFRPINKTPLLDHYVSQAKYLTIPVLACINRARNEGTSLIIEGSNILPSLISPELVDLFIVLKIASATKHRDFLIGSTHKYRKLAEHDFRNIRKIQNFVIDVAKETSTSNLLIIENSDINISLQLIKQAVGFDS